MKKHNGFTLIELLWVIVITAILAAIGGSVLNAGIRSYVTGVAIAPLSTKAMIAMTRIIMDLKQAVSFSAMHATSVTFTQGDGTTVTYSISGSTLSRSQNGGTRFTLTDQIIAPSLFTYYNSALEVTPTRTAVRAITVSFALQGTVGSYPLITTVYLRNM